MSKKIIKLLVDWEHFKKGDVIKEDVGIALTMIQHGRAKEWNGRNTKIIKNNPKNKMIKKETIQNK